MYCRTVEETVIDRLECSRNAKNDAYTCLFIEFCELLAKYKSKVALVKCYWLRSWTSSTFPSVSVFRTEPNWPLLKQITIFSSWICTVHVFLLPNLRTFSKIREYMARKRKFSNFNRSKDFEKRCYTEGLKDFMIRRENYKKCRAAAHVWNTEGREEGARDCTGSKVVWRELFIEKA